MGESSHNFHQLLDNEPQKKSQKYEISSKIDVLEKVLVFFVNIYESPASTLRTSDNQKLKRYFQIASTLENAIMHLVDINQTKNGNILLKKIFGNNNVSCNYDIMFFKDSCDHLLSRLFTINETTPYKIEVAVRIYMSILPPVRFEKFLNKLLVESSSYQEIEHFLLINDKLDVKFLQLKLILTQWISDYMEGQYVELNPLIDDMLSPYKVQQNLHLFIGIIAFETETLEESKARLFVLRKILDKMFCRRAISKKFWLSLFEIDHVLLLKACILSQEFHLSVCNFLTFVGSMMDVRNEKGKKKWVPSSTSVYPEFTYDWLLKIFRNLSHTGFSSRDLTMKKLLDAEEETGCSIWRHLLMTI